MELSKNETPTPCKECMYFVDSYKPRKHSSTRLVVCMAKLDHALTPGTVEHFQDWEHVRYGFQYRNDGCCGRFKPRQDVGESRGVGKGNNKEEV
jgi:hypothetical protein